MEFFRNINIDWIGKKWLFIGLSFVLSGAGLISLILKHGPLYGIDFKGGTNVHVKFRQAPDLEKLRELLRTQGLGSSTLQRYGNEGSSEVLVGLDLTATKEEDLEAGRQSIINALRKEFGGSDKQSINEASVQSIGEKLSAVGLTTDQAKDAAQAIVTFRDSPPRSGLLSSIDELSGVKGVTPEILTALKANYSITDFAVRNVEIVGPKVGAALRKQALNATLLALASMLIYIAFRFEWIYGVAAVVATFHDVIIAVGFLSLFHKEITLTVIAALLTLVGYSVNDTIVVFDRIRENVKISRRENITDLVNRSINQTLSRTILTSGLTFLTVISLYIFGGEVLRGFSFTLVVGILVGTYSSIAIGSTMVVSWIEYLDRGRKSGNVAVTARDSVRIKSTGTAAKVKV